MPAAFSEAERERIVRLLCEAGLRLFPERGLRKTSLDDLVRPAGIAKSTFYMFFDSKEALYLELMRRQLLDVRRQVIDEGLEQGVDTRDALRRFLAATVEMLTTNPLYHRLMTHPEEMEAVSAKVSPRTLEGLAADNPVAALTEFVTRRQREGELIPADTDVVIGVLRVVLLLPAHKEQLGPELFPEILDLVIDFVATGLTAKEKRA